jgi:hypothetical protein
MIDYEDAKETKAMWDAILKEREEDNFTQRFLEATKAFNQIMNQ